MEKSENTGGGNPAITSLTGKQARYLRGLGHGLKPVIQVGKLGWDDRVAAQVEGCLLAHELVKIKVLETSPLSRDEIAGLLVARSGALIAQKVGRTLLIYRPHPDNPFITLPLP